MNATYADPPFRSEDTQGPVSDATHVEPRNILVDSITALDIQGRMTRHPYQTLLIAAGVGYILGGGLFTRLTASVFRVGIKIGALPSVQRQLIGVAEAALSARSTRSS